MKDLLLGDMVRVRDNAYEPVYSFGHRNGSVSAEFLQIVSSGSPLEVSKNHMLLVQGDRAVPASTIKVGDLLVTADGHLAPVRAIHDVLQNGVFAPFTKSGYIVVNGIVASTYIAYQDSEYLIVAGYGTISFQRIAHTFESVHRMAHRMGVMGETYTEGGVSRWVDVPHKVFSWLLEQHAAVVAVVTVPILALFSFVAFLENISHTAFGTLAILGIPLYLTKHWRSSRKASE